MFLQRGSRTDILAFWELTSWTFMLSFKWKHWEIFAARFDGGNVTRVPRICYSNPLRVRDSSDVYDVLFILSPPHLQEKSSSY